MFYVAGRATQTGVKFVDKPSYKGGAMLRQYAMWVGIIFLVIGLLGFIPAFTPNDMLFGVFMVNAVHNWIHILSGVIGILAAVSVNPRAQLGYAWFILVGYGLITILGFMLVRGPDMLFGIIAMNPADNVLHLLLTLSALVVILAAQRRPVFR